MSGIPRQRSPYVEHCPHCPGPKPVPVRPVLVTPTVGGGVMADYLCPAGHVWATAWQRDPDHDRWAA